MPTPKWIPAPPDHARHGSLDIPTTVWNIRSPRDFIYGLVTELKPTGQALTIDIDGWECLPRDFDHSVTVLTTQPGLPQQAYRKLDPHHHQCVDIAEVDRNNLTQVLRGFSNTFGLIIAPAEVLQIPGAIQALTDPLSEEGFLVLVTENDQAASEIALWSTEATQRESGDWAFIGSLAVTSQEVLDLAAATPQLPCISNEPVEKRPRGHSGVSIWTKKPQLPLVREAA